jgi:heme A synthase
VKRAGKWVWHGLAATSTIQYAAGFLAIVVAIVVAGYTNLPTGLRIALGVALFGFITCLLIALIPLLPASLQRKAKAQPRPAMPASAPPRSRRHRSSNEAMKKGS